MDLGRREATTPLTTDSGPSGIHAWLRAACDAAAAASSSVRVPRGTLATMIMTAAATRGPSTRHATEQPAAGQRTDGDRTPPGCRDLRCRGWGVTPRGAIAPYRRGGGSDARRNQTFCLGGESACLEEELARVLDAHRTRDRWPKRSAWNLARSALSRRRAPARHRHGRSPRHRPVSAPCGSRCGSARRRSSGKSRCLTARSPCTFARPSKPRHSVPPRRSAACFSVRRTTSF